jgi:hypothetical protein
MLVPKSLEIEKVPNMGFMRRSNRLLVMIGQTHVFLVLAHI